MKWTAFRIKTVTDAEDILISALYDIGLEGAQIEDKVPLTASDKERMFVDILPDIAEDDGIAYVTFFCGDRCGRHASSFRHKEDEAGASFRNRT